jgi:lipoprotein-anchoring transpeptidase ErfK/SrfK
LKTSSILLASVLAASLSVPAVAQSSTKTEVKAEAKSESTSESKPCHWWQFRKCEETTIDGLPPEAPKNGTVVTVDLTTNTLYLFKDGELVTKSAAATGTEKLLKSGSKVWLFRTPRGHHKVLRKIEDPVWHKPDWAFVEAGEKVPPPDSPKRLVKNHLGKYALDLGDGIMIHGTDDVDSIGRKASHGCVRLPDKALETVWANTQIGTDVFIFESGSAGGAVVERHSDLDF